MNRELSELALRAFVYGYPLVAGLEQVRRYATTGVGANPAAPYNSLSHARTLAGPGDRFVSINNDTVYSFAQLDLSVGPVLLEMPDCDDRYYVAQFVSAWTENFAYIGKRATGSRAGRYLIGGPTWSGSAAADIVDATVIRSPTQICSMVARWAVDNEADLASVARLQDAMTLTPTGAGVATGLPDIDVADLEESLAFWESYRVLSQTFPPPPRDRRLQDGFASLGLTGSIPVGDLSRGERAALSDGFGKGADAIRQILRGDGSTGACRSILNAFDYNLDHFEIGAMDDPRWKITDPVARLATRAAAAMGGLWGAHSYEAAYFTAHVDDQGRTLTGEHDYALTLEPPPPNDAFWSLTMYDVPDYFLVPNIIDRYSIGDRTPGLIAGRDGAVQIALSSSPPDPESAPTNWLPTPSGPFRLILRVYLPGASVLDGSYVLPPIRRRPT